MLANLVRRSLELELFAFPPRPQMPAKARHGSTVGLCCTLIVLGIVVSYAVSSISRLSRSGKSTTVTTHTTISTPVVFMPLSLRLPMLNDPRYFTMSEYRVAGSFGGVENRTALAASQNGTDTVTLDGLVTGQPTFLQNDCARSGCTYVRVKVLPCLNTSAIACATADQINDIVNNNFLQLQIFGAARDGSPQSIIVQLSLKDALSFRQRFPFDASLVVDQPNYFTNWATRHTATLQLTTPWFSIDRLPRLSTVVGGNEYCKLDFQLTGFLQTDTHIVETSLDAIGEIAAFFGAVCGVFALVVAAYNEHDFYKKYPHWAQVSENFSTLSSLTEPSAAVGPPVPMQVTEPRSM